MKPQTTMILAAAVLVYSASILLSMIILRPSFPIGIQPATPYMFALLWIACVISFSIIRKYFTEVDEGKQ